MKIAMLSPTNMSASAASSAMRAEREEILNHFAPKGMSVRLIDNPDGPPAIETLADEYRCVPGLLKIAEAHQGEYDGYITGCFSEPGLPAVRELVRIPAVGCCGPAVHMANMMGRSFVVLSPLKSTVVDTAELIVKYGLRERLAAVEALDIPVLEIRKDRQRVVETAGEIARRAAQVYDAECFVLGCMSLAYQNVAQEIAQLAGRPVINPLHTSLLAIHYLVTHYSSDH